MYPEGSWLKKEKDMGLGRLITFGLAVVILLGISSDGLAEGTASKKRIKQCTMQAFGHQMQAQRVKDGFQMVRAWGPTFQAQVFYKYDDAGRITEEAYSHNGQVYNKIETKYDEKGRVIWGRLPVKGKVYTKTMTYNDSEKTGTIEFTASDQEGVAAKGIMKLDDRGHPSITKISVPETKGGETTWKHVETGREKYNDKGQLVEQVLDTLQTDRATGKTEFAFYVKLTYSYRADGQRERELQENSVGFRVRVEYTYDELGVLKKRERFAQTKGGKEWKTNAWQYADYIFYE